LPGTRGREFTGWGDRCGSGTLGWLTMIKDAYRFLLPLLALAAIALYAGWTAAGVLFLLLSAFVAYFFRNPPRTIPPGEHRIVSPADGRVVCVTSVPEEAEEMPGGQRISIFLNIFNVHVTRAPIRGALERLEYRRGKFKVAYDEEASRVNEQNVLTIRGRETRVVVKQIAGLIARRVVCWKRPGDAIERGELFGLIRFGSRVDILLTRDVKILVKVGERVQGGSSVIGEAPQ
jgi:phosphatidylserine decarboxylase